MIQRLIIQNVALIERAEIEFCRGLNILSGETGAGKSVILDSVNFVLGAKADKSMIRYGETQCSVYAEFDIDGNEEVKKALAELEIDEDDSLIVSRKFTADGKSSVKINGTPANASMLKKITSCLVDVHGQSEHFYLLKESNQLKVLDNVVGEKLTALKETLRDKIKALKANKAEIEKIGVDDGERSRRMDILSFQIEEITSAALREGEEDELIAKRNKFNSVEKILSALREAENALQADGSGVDALRSAARSVQSISSLDGEYASLGERLDNLQSEAEDVAETISSLSEDVYFDEEEAEETERRIEEIKKLKRKYGANISDVFTFLQRAKEDYDRLADSGAETERLQKEIDKTKREIYDLCKKITALRKDAAKGFTERVIAELRTLNIPSAKFSVDFGEYGEGDVERATSEGLDGVQFVFSANAGEPVKPLSKIISGGEMSRFMLAIKTQLSGINGISTYIFDEIDAGISGQTAKVVAEKFAKISGETQVIAVSHLAQIACMADREFLIEKRETDGKTKTEVKSLDREGRLKELIRLLGGESESKIVRQHAEEMLETAEKYKSTLQK
jgi:DNA repair protein RecN (Recombination protein N)